MAKSEKYALVLMTDRAVSTPLAAKLEAIGWKPIVVENVEALKNALGGTRAYAAAYIDIRVSPTSAAQVVSYVRRAIPLASRVIVADRVLDSKAIEESGLKGEVTLLGAPHTSVAAIIAKITAVPGAAPKQAARYDVNVINCFVSSVNDVLEYYVGEKPDHQTPKVAKTKKVPAEFVVAVVTFTGNDQTGSASLSCEKAFIIEIAARVNGASRRDLESDQEALAQTLEDMADQVFGKAELLLGKLGYDLTVGRPDIRMGAGQDIELKGDAPIVIIPFTMAGKKFSVGYSLAAL